MDLTTMDVVYFYLKNVLGTLVALFVVRVLIVYIRVRKKEKYVTLFRVSAKLMIVLGSGGHTYEMLELLKNVDHQIRPRIYVSADTDKFSETKARKFEEFKHANDKYQSELVEVFYEKIPRSREVGQSWISTVFSTLRALLSSICVIYKHMPDAVLCNGPGTCVPICLAAVFFHILGVKHIQLIYVESMCRVKTLSFSGNILYYFADYFYVNWPELKQVYPRTELIRLF